LVQQAGNDGQAVGTDHDLKTWCPRFESGSRPFGSHGGRLGAVHEGGPPPVQAPFLAPEAAEHWLSRHPEGTVLDIDDAYEFGRKATRCCTG
jgi:hypothetical protein